MGFEKENQTNVTCKNDELTITEIQRGAEIFKLLFEWQQQFQERVGNQEELDEAS